MKGEFGEVRVLNVCQDSECKALLAGPPPSKNILPSLSSFSCSGSAGTRMMMLDEGEEGESWSTKKRRTKPLPSVLWLAKTPSLGRGNNCYSSEI